MNTKVILKPATDLVWAFESSKPSVCLDADGGYRTYEVDPFPAYAHDEGIVNKEVERVTALFPITWPVTFYLLSNECTSRTNAFAQPQDWDYKKKISEVEGKENYARIPHIVLSGKRIPPMPAMTRYLVSHEYGHVVEDWIADKRGQKDFELMADYAKLRELTFPKGYPGKWHLTPGEIFANDFRLLICKTEPEFWPHPCQRPEENYAVIGWWEKAKELLIP